MSKAKKISVARGDFRIVWEGGEYADVYGPGVGAFETINMMRDGSPLPFGRASLREAVDAESLQDWETSHRELVRYPSAGAR